MEKQNRRGRKLETLSIRDIAHLCCHLGLSKTQLERLLASTDSNYREGEITVDGKKRKLAIPREPLMTALRNLNRLMQRLRFPPCMYGGLSGHSNIDNARAHTSTRAVLRADIKDFFPSIDRARVRRVFEEKLRCSASVADILAQLCTYQDKLPQGAPPSTVIANLAIEHLSFRLYRLATKHGATYTQFVDDITISGPGHVESLEPLVAKMIEEEGFRCHPDKLYTRRHTQEQLVTGVRVNSGCDVPSDKIEEVRAQIKRCGEEIARGKTVSEKELRTLDGKIAYITRLNRGSGKFLGRRFRALHKLAV